MPRDNGSKTRVKVQCKGCGKNFNGFLYGAHPSNPYDRLTSCTLTRHLNASLESDRFCFEHYNSGGLAKICKKKGKLQYNFTTSELIGLDPSLITTPQATPAENGSLPQQAQPPQHIPRVLNGVTVYKQIGLPTPDLRNKHRSINHHTIYTPGLDFHESVVESLLFEPPEDSGQGLPHSTSTTPVDVDSSDSEISFTDAADLEETMIPGLADLQETMIPGSTEPAPALEEESNNAGQTESTQNEQTSKRFVIDSKKDLFTVKPSDNRLKVEVDLMNIMIKHKMPLAAFDSIWKWAHRSHANYSYNVCAPPRKRATIIADICKLATDTDKNLDRFQPTTIDWLPSKKKVQIHVRDFRYALKSLLMNKELVKEHNLSFPDAKLPYIWKGFPEPGISTEISELHHGHWWVRSWKQSLPLKSKIDSILNDREVKDILVPVILYMDGISLDAHGRLSLTPLNMTLGIFNTEARKRADAWETIYFHPNPTEVQIAQNTKANQSSTDKCQNLHNGIAKALESFFEACNGEEEFIWEGLPYGGKIWTVRMKFAIAYVVGDSELHDQLCGRKKAYVNTNILCRHCNVCPEHLVDPLNQLDANNQPAKLWQPSDFDQCQTIADLDRISHHKITNAFHRHNFGANPHNIHFATPGELLHMHQLGPAKRAVEAFKALVNHELTSSTQNQSKENKSYLEICSLCQVYGGYMARQSDRDFPRTKFSTVHILKTSMKEGSHYSGILLTIVLAIVSTYGKNRCTSPPINLTNEELAGFLETIELIMAMEEFLKYGGIQISDLPSLEEVVVEFLENINTHCKRNTNASAGFGLRLLKNHLYLHLVELIRFFGTMAGTDSSFAESHHRFEIKAPSKNTQCRASQLIQQTGTRQFEMRLIRDAAREFLDPEPATESRHPTPADNWEEGEVIPKWFGPSFTIFFDEATQKPRMVWDEKRRRSQPTHCDELLNFCVDKILKNQIKGSTLRGYTEHHRIGKDGQKYIYRAHPSFRSNVGLKCNQWYDWAYFDHAEHGELPGHIMCFLEIKRDEFVDSNIYNRPSTDGFFCVTREFQSPPAPIPGCRLVKKGRIDLEYSLRECGCITGDVAVVPNIKERVDDEFECDLNFLVVGNRREWLTMFWDKIDEKNTSGRKRRRSGE